MFNSMGIYVRRRHLSLPPLTPRPSVANGDSLPFVGPQPYRWLL